MKNLIFILFMLFYADTVSAQYPYFKEEGDDFFSEMYSFYENAEAYKKYKDTPEWQAYLTSEEYLKDKENWDIYYKELENDDIAASIVESRCQDLSDFICAAAVGNAKRIQFLLDNGANIDEKLNNGMTAMVLASKERSDLKVIEVLGNAEIAKYGKISAEALAAAIDRNNQHPEDEAVITKILEMGADVNGRTKYGLTPLMVAMRGISPNRVQALIDAGADVNAKLKRGDFPIYDDMNNDDYTPGSYIHYLWNMHNRPEQISALTIGVDFRYHNMPYEMLTMLLENGAVICPKEFSFTCYHPLEHHKKYCEILNGTGYHEYQQKLLEIE